jgi:superfamily I DNA/RNA helicase
MSHTFWVSEDDLDTAQKKATKGIGLDESFLLRGPAGSGKTNVLLLRARWLKYRKLSHFRLVVFTASLKTFVQSGCEQYGVPADSVVTCMQLFRELLSEYGVPFETTGSFESDRTLLAGKLNALLEDKKIANVFDALLVDEAQDYTDTEIRIFRRLSSRLLLAADSRQSIYKNTHTAGLLDEIVDSVVDLKYHYRSGLKLCTVADAILKDSAGYPAMHAESKYDEKARPSSVTLVSCASLEDQISRIIAKLEAQLSLYTTEQIGVLFPKREQQAQFSDALQLASLDGAARVWTDTLHGSKGWEFRAVHIGGCETLYKMGAVQKRLVYTGILRGRTSATLYFTGQVPGYLESAVASIAPPEEDPPLSALFG